MKRLLFLLLVLTAGCCTQCHSPAEKTGQLPVVLPAPRPCRYQVVYRDRATWVDPSVVAIEHRGEYLLDQKKKSRR